LTPAIPGITGGSFRNRFRGAVDHRDSAWRPYLAKLMPMAPWRRIASTMKWRACAARVRSSAGGALDKLAQRGG